MTANAIVNRNAFIAVALIAVLAMYVVWQGLQLLDVKAELATLNEARAHWNQDNQQQVDQHRQTIADLQQQLKETQDQVAATRPVVAVATSQSSPPPQVQPAREVDFAKQQALLTEVRRLNAERSVQLRFGSFLAPLKLSPAVQTLITTRTADALQHWAELGRKAASGEASSAEMEEIKSLNQPAEMRRIMADYLTPQQMTAFTEYQAQIRMKR